MFKCVFTYISSILPFRMLYRLARPPVVAPFYHMVSNETPSHIKHLYSIVTPEQFSRDLDFMLKHFIPVNLSEIPSILAKERKLSKPALFLSFDDGFRELASVVVPILLHKGVPATFFVSPAFIDNKDMMYRCKLSIIAERVIESGKSFKAPGFLISQWGNNASRPKNFIKNLFKLDYNNMPLIESIAHAVDVNLKKYLENRKPYLTTGELRMLAGKGFNIGAHSFNHPNFADIPLESQIEEVNKSVEWIKQNIADRPPLFSFPFTDIGVSKEFYSYFFKQNPGIVEMIFGTAGYKPATSNRLLNRICMEYENLPAKTVLGGEFLYYLAKAIINKHKTIIAV